MSWLVSLIGCAVFFVHFCLRGLDCGGRGYDAVYRRRALSVGVKVLMRCSGISCFFVFGSRDGVILRGRGRGERHLLHGSRRSVYVY